MQEIIGSSHSSKYTLGRRGSLRGPFARRNNRHGQVLRKVVRTISGPHQRTEHSNHIENFPNGSLIEGVSLNPIADKRRDNIGLQIGKRWDKISFRSSIFGMSAEVKVETRGFSRRARGGRTT
jgi:hypothetical protein